MSRTKKALVAPHIEKWLVQARSLPQERTPARFPTHAVTGEAVDTSLFLTRYWESETDAKGRSVRPGLGTASPLLDRRIGKEIEELKEAVDWANERFRLLRPKAKDDVMDRGDQCRAQLVRVLEFVGSHPDHGDVGETLAGIVDAHADDPYTPDAKALELRELAALAEETLGAVAGVGGLDRELVRDARAVADGLRLLRTKPGRPADGESASALDLRNRIAHLLEERIVRVRAAARFVFHDHPAILRECASNYDRRRRALSTRRKNAKEEPPVQPVFPTEAANADGEEAAPSSNAA